jgi:hypothetical protein
MDVIWIVIRLILALYGLYSAIFAKKMYNSYQYRGVRIYENEWLVISCIRGHGVLIIVAVLLSFLN